MYAVQTAPPRALPPSADSSAHAARRSLAPVPESAVFGESEGLRGEGVQVEENGEEGRWGY